MGTTAHPPVYPWQMSQPQWVTNQCLPQPNQVTPTWPDHPIVWPNPVNNPAIQWQLPTLPSPPVAVTPATNQQQSQVPQPLPVTTTATESQQPTPISTSNYIPPIMPGVITAFNQTDLPGKPIDVLISTHVPQSIKNKVLSYSYVDLGVLIDTHNPDKQEQFDLMPDRQTNNITLKASNKHVNITSFTLWNKAFHILIELTTCKWPHLCLPMVHYSHFINKQAGKFPFQQVYAYDKKFHHQMNTNLAIPWNQIDNQLWSRELHGQAIKEKPADSNFLASALTTIEANVQGQHVDSLTDVTSATEAVTLQSSAEARLSAQVLQHHIVTLVNPTLLDHQLHGHPNCKLVQHIIDGFTFGFSLKYNGPRTGHVHPNRKSAHQYPDLLWRRINKEQECGRILGPCSG